MSIHKKRIVLMCCMQPVIHVVKRFKLHHIKIEVVRLFDRE